MSDESDAFVKFAPFSSLVDNSFWHKLCQLKLDVDKLEETRRDLKCFYLHSSGCIASVDYSSFNQGVERVLNTSKYTTLQFLCCSSAHSYPLLSAVGTHINFNTPESLKSFDKNDALKNCGSLIEQHIVSGEAFKNPSLLSTFVLLTFADLKAYDFAYWFGFPAPYKFNPSLSKDVTVLGEIMEESQIQTLFTSHKSLPPESEAVFGFCVTEESLICFSLKKYIDCYNSGENGSLYLCFLDPSSDPHHPGWPLRNILSLIAYYRKPGLSDAVQVLCLRVGQDFRKSPVLTIDLNGCELNFTSWIGWERNPKGTFGPKRVSLKDSMDPVRLAESSSMLNLKLMKWRLAPTLNLDEIGSQRCLILGAGTLGCAIARNLVAWGVRHVTFVDKGSVSYSNPVRQNLFTLKDCGKPKAGAASLALKCILPSVVSNGHCLEIPMPGHSTAALEDAERLGELIASHDVCFLVTDSRESRWLPTVICTSLNKLAITAALGFDSYLVMRHGLASEGAKLGCYFCNDVTAPGNSKLDRTLDQQCTVTRPAVSSVAAALAVELMVSVLQHTSKGCALATDESILGVIPHSIRGFLHDFSQISPSTSSFQKCVACSAQVVKLYASERNDFLQNVFKSSTYLEDITGLTELQNSTGALDSMTMIDVFSDETDEEGV